MLIAAMRRDSIVPRVTIAAAEAQNFTGLNETSQLVLNNALQVKSEDVEAEAQNLTGS